MTRQNYMETKKLEYVNIAGVQMNFQRTCRVPEGKMNGLPAGLGSFPVYRVSDFKSGVPSEWREDGFFFPMYNQEATWMNLQQRYVSQGLAGVDFPTCVPKPRPRRSADPHALIIGAGNINAISGKPFDSSVGKRCVSTGLDVKLEKEQNYVVVPTQPWIDGWKAEDGKVYQFVAAELGSGQTVEGQITGVESVGGIQFIAYAAKDPAKLRKILPPTLYGAECALGGSKALRCASSVMSMGLGRGGEIEQKIYPDPYGIEVWQDKPVAVEVVYLVSSNDFKQITGHDAPPTPVTYEEYQRQGLPWFGLHDKHWGDSSGSDVFGKLKPVSGKEDLLDKLKLKK